MKTYAKKKFAENNKALAFKASNLSVAANRDYINLSVATDKFF